MIYLITIINLKKSLSKSNHYRGLIAKSSSSFLQTGVHLSAQLLTPLLFLAFGEVLPGFPSLPPQGFVCRSVAGPKGLLQTPSHHLFPSGDGQEPREQPQSGACQGRRGRSARFPRAPRASMRSNIDQAEKNHIKIIKSKPRTDPKHRGVTLNTVFPALTPGLRRPALLTELPESEHAEADARRSDALLPGHARIRAPARLAMRCRAAPRKAAQPAVPKVSPQTPN